MTQLESAERAEYQEIIDQVKHEFKEKMQEAISTEKRLMAKDAAELLGKEFSDLVSERKKLIEQFSTQSRKVLSLAIQIGLKDKITALSEAINDKNAKDAKDIRKSATAMFADVVNAVEEHDEELAKQLRLIERRLAVNNKAMNDLVALKKPEIEQIEKKYKQKLQKILVDIALDFNKRIVVINKEFGVTSEKIVLPQIADDETKDLKVTLDGDAEGFFIPSDTDDVN